MKIGALAATAANVLLLTFFIFQSFQSPFGRKGQDGGLVDMQRQAMLAAEEHFKLGSPSAESHFKPWIKKDMSIWAQEGIAIVSQSLLPQHSCHDPQADLDGVYRFWSSILTPLSSQGMQAEVWCYCLFVAAQMAKRRHPIHQECRSAGDRSLPFVQEQVNEMASRYKECFGEVFRFQILNSTLWIDHISERHNGWYPASSGPGELGSLSSPS